MNQRPSEMTGDGGAVGAPPLPLVPRVISVFGWIGVAVLLVPIVLTCADIVWRRAIGGAFMDTFDITKLCLVAAAAWTIPYGFVHGSHVTVDLLLEQFPARLQTLADGLIHLVCGALFVLLGWLSWNGAMLHYSYGDTTQNLALPVVYYWAIFIVGLALAVVACLWRSFAAFRRLRGGSPS
ncbi:TRAP transporter small permease [Jiella sp. M17.18]|uniref:TRAP transporter small permease n=1 Tax=Jiella sp. M17.18 TaxID=3234247 RepID=UPI0034DF72E4